MGVVRPAHADCARPEAWHVLLTLAANQNTQLEFRLWGLSSLVDVVELMDVASRSQLRQEMQRSIGVWAADVPVVVGKASLLFVRLLRADYPSRWPTAFAEVIDLILAPSVDFVELGFRIMIALDEEVISEASGFPRAQAMVIKDHLRNTQLEQLMSAMYNRLSALAAETSAPAALALTCGIEALGYTFGWVDLVLVASTQHIDFLMSLTKHQEASVRNEAWEAAAWLLNKRAPGFKKVELTSMLLPSVLAPGVEPSQAYYDTLNICGVELVDALVDLTPMVNGTYEPKTAEEALYSGGVPPATAQLLLQRGWGMTSQVYDASLEALKRISLEDSAVLEPFLNSFVKLVTTYVEKGIPLQLTSSAVCKSLLDCLNGLFLVVQLPPSADLHEDSPVLEARDQWVVVMRRILRFRRDTFSVEWIEQRMDDLASGRLSVPAAEAYLALLYTYLDCWKDLSKPLKDHHRVSSVLSSLFSLPLPVQSVPFLTLYFDLIARVSVQYGLLSPGARQHMVLNLLSPNGLFSREGVLVTKASVALLRLVRNNHSSFTALTPRIVESLTPLLEVPVLDSSFAAQALNGEPWPANDGNYLFDDQLRVFAVAGLLLRSSSEQIPKALSIVGMLNQSLLRAEPSSNSAVAVFLVTRCLQCLAQLVQAFSRPDPQYMPLWHSCLQNLVWAMAHFGDSPDVRSAVLQLCRRVAVSLKADSISVVKEVCLCILEKVYTSISTDQAGISFGRILAKEELCHLSNFVAYACHITDGTSQLLLGGDPVFLERILRGNQECADVLDTDDLQVQSQRLDVLVASFLLTESVCREAQDLPEVLGQVPSVGRLLMLPVAPTTEKDIQIMASQASSWKILADRVGTVVPIDFLAAARKFASLLPVMRPQRAMDVKFIGEVAELFKRLLASKPELSTDLLSILVQALPTADEQSVIQCLERVTGARNPRDVRDPLVHLVQVTKT